MWILPVIVNPLIWLWPEMVLISRDQGVLLFLYSLSCLLLSACFPAWFKKVEHVAFCAIRRLTYKCCNVSPNGRLVWAPLYHLFYLHNSVILICSACVKLPCKIIYSICFGDYSWFQRSDYSTHSSRWIYLHFVNVCLITYVIFFIFNRFVLMKLITALFWSAYPIIILWCTKYEP